MAAAASGPQGTGLLPPGRRLKGQQDNDPDDDDDDDGLPEVPPPGDDEDENDEIDDDEIDAPPVVGDEDDGDEDEEDDEYVDLEAFEQELLDKMQRRFDRAISKALRKAGQRDEGDDDDDEDDDGKKKKRRRPASAPVDRAAQVRSVRVLVRDRIDDEMERAGQEERRACKAVLDAVVPYLDLADADEEDVVDDLVETLQKVTKDLVKTGSDRKVAQLRSMGLVPERKGQTGSTTARKKTAPQTAMQRGAKRAQARWPKGRRRLGG